MKAAKTDTLMSRIAIHIALEPKTGKPVSLVRVCDLQTAMGGESNRRAPRRWKWTNCSAAFGAK